MPPGFGWTATRLDDRLDEREHVRAPAIRSFQKCNGPIDVLADAQRKPRSQSAEILIEAAGAVRPKDTERKESYAAHFDDVQERAIFEKQVAENGIDVVRVRCRLSSQFRRNHFNRVTKNAGGDRLGLSDVLLRKSAHDTDRTAERHPRSIRKTTQTLHEFYSAFTCVTDGVLRSVLFSKNTDISGSWFPLPFSEMSVGKRPPPLRSLTTREFSIAERIARGMSNPEIALDLDISRRTVDTHVTNILRKAGLRSRLMLAALIIRHSVGP